MLPTAFNCVPLKGVPSAIAAGVAQVTAACRCSVRVSGAVTLVENVGLETIAETDEVVLGAPPVALAATDTVISDRIARAGGECRWSCRSKCRPCRSSRLCIRHGGGRKAGGQA